MSRADVLNPALSLFVHAQVGRSRHALVIGDAIYTYEALATEAGRVATWLRTRPFRRAASSGERIPRVGILAARSLESYAGILGTLWAGATYVPLNLAQHPADLLSIVTRCDLDAVIVDHRGSERLDELAPALPLHLLAGDGVTIDLPSTRVTWWRALAEQNDADPPAPLGPDHPAYIFFSTEPPPAAGTLKGVVISAASLAHFLLAMRALYQFGPKDRFAQLADISTDASIYEIFACWDGGGCLHVAPESALAAPAPFLRQRNITVSVADPSIIPALARLGQIKRGTFPWLRVSIFLSDGLPIEDARAWEVAAPHSAVDSHFGPTEATSACLWTRLTNPPVETPGRGTLPIGEPFPAMSAEIINEGGAFLPAGQSGELALSGPQLALGYLGDEALTSQRFPTLFHPRLGYSRWFRTGHPASRDQQGIFHSPGHIDTQIKVLGHRVAVEEA